MAGKNVVDKFLGCMLGGVLGDCLGAPVECLFWSGLDKSAVRKRFNGYMGEEVGGVEEVMKYTDDTAMAMEVAFSLIRYKGVVNVADLARHFVAEFKREPWRGYGQSVGEVFRKLELVDLSSEDAIFAPAREQFNGQGSYGNGAAMRTHPIGLSCRNVEEVSKLAALQGRITHSHPLGVNGAVLQAVGVHLALKGASTEDTLKTLKTVAMTEFGEKLDSTSRNSDDSPTSYLTQLQRIEVLLERQMDNDTESLRLLGNDIAAVSSVPTALYCFLRSRSGPVIRGLCTDNPFQHTLELAMTFGGDSDTIMSMSGALAGAYYGAAAIPQRLINLCEGVEVARDQANKLYEIVINSKS